MRHNDQVVVLDLDAWDALNEWASALHHEGLKVVRVTTPRTGLRRALDKWRYGSEPVAIADLRHIAEVTRLLGWPTVDVQGPENAVRALREALPVGSPLLSLLNRVGAGVPEDVIYDKWLTTEHARSVGLQVPASWLAAPSGHFPVVVKGRISAGGQDVAIANSASELDAVVSQLSQRNNGGLFFQEALPGAVINAAGVAHGGRLLVHAIYRAEPDPADPLGPPRVLTIVDRPDVLEQMSGLVESLKFSGIFCLDYVDDAEGNCALVDLNPRVFGGWLQLQAAGVDFLGAYLQVLREGGLSPAETLCAGTQLDTRLVPRTPQEWTQWRRGVSTSTQEIKRVSGITGWRFAAVKAASAVAAAARQAKALLRS